MLHDALNFFIDIIFPPICIKCGKINKNWICNKCYKSIMKLKIVNNENLNYNNDKINFDKFLYLFNYNGIIRKLIIDYKFNNKAYISNFFAKMILKDYKICRKIEEYDLFIPVPMYIKKKKQRGYNQTELIAKIICDNLKITLDITSLIKIKNTKTQSTLSARERKENIKNVFLVKNSENIKNKKVIIFDDIFTTGQTADEISRVLKNAGVKEIFVLVLAKD